MTLRDEEPARDTQKIILVLCAVLFIYTFRSCHLSIHITHPDSTRCVRAGSVKTVFVVDRMLPHKAFSRASDARLTLEFYVIGYYFR